MKAYPRRLLLTGYLLLLGLAFVVLNAGPGWGWPTWVVALVSISLATLAGLLLGSGRPRLTQSKEKPPNA